jgi:hypothetical protein
MIPAFYDENNLPPGRHSCTLMEIGDRFGQGERRQKLFARLCTLAALGKECGFRALVIFGSFVSSKLEPGDIDLFWITHPEIDTDTLRAECKAILDSEKTKAEFNFDVFWCPDEQGSVDRMTALWGQDRSFRDRGLLMIELNSIGCA